MKNKKSADAENQHQFAFYYQGLSDLLGRDIDITIICDDLYHRFKHVVRMHSDDTCILFNQKERVLFRFAKFEGKNKIVGTWQHRTINVVLQPEIIFILPLLKIDALSEAVYALAEVGINTIQLVTTEKTQTPYSEKLFDKLQRVAVAAAEQSKMYAFPTIVPPVALDCLLAQNLVGEKYHFDVTGVPFAQWYTPIDSNQSYYLLVGPEGDLTMQEKNAAHKAGFQACLLTPTVLRAVRSISLISGLFRL